MNEREIFTAASQIDDAKLRGTFLDAVCQGDLLLRYRIDKLLKAQAASGDLVERPGRLFEQLAGEIAGPDKTDIDPDVSQVSSSSSPGQLKPGTIIGPYQIQQLLGEGGMGVVYVAKQTMPVKRQVALKILRPGDNSRNILARFEQERHALAMMDHPGIAKILDAGTTEDGRPYFVMELVKGIPISDYCDRENLSPKERLQLFIPVCAAVQHAHQKGIIHRDLKPSNILIALYDGQPIPKVIDFGVAKAVGFRLSADTVYTEVGSIVGTIEYMAPEQAELNNLDIDTRADVYALGVILYELLTGGPPFTRLELRSAAFDEMLRMIREVEPQKPSTKISSSGEIASIAAHRKLEPRQLTRLLSGDLDWVVMKALAKERKLRYQSVGDFSSDVNRFLNDEAVTAGPPKFSYRARKFLKRNRVLAIATALVVLAILGGGIAAMLGWLESGRQYKVARSAETAERAAREVAESRLKQVENGIQILTNVFDDLNPARNENVNTDLRTILSERLDQAAAQLDGDAIGDSLVVARMQYRLARSLLELGFPQRAIDVLEKAERVFLEKLGPDDLELLNCQDTRATCLTDCGEFKPALELLQKTLVAKKRAFGESHIDTIGTLNNIGGALSDLGDYSASIAQYDQALGLMQTHFGPNNPATITTAHNLAAVRLESGDTQQALAELEDVLTRRKKVLGHEHHDTQASLMSVAAAFRATGKPEKALPLVEESLRINQKLLGPEHPNTLLSMSNLAMLYKDLGQKQNAVPLLEQATRQLRLKLGNSHPDTLTSISSLAVAYKDVGELELAMPLYLESLEQRRKALGPEHPDTLTSINNLGAMYIANKQLDLAIPLLEECLELRQKVLGPDNPAVGQTINNLAKACQDSGQLERAIGIYREALAYKERTQGVDHPSTLAGMYNLANALRLHKDFDGAIGLFQSILKRGEEREGGLPPTLAAVPELLATVFREASRPEDAENQLRTVMEDYQTRLGKQSPDALRLQSALGQILMESDKLAEAEAVARECLDSRIELEPELWTTYQTRCLLGAILMKQQQLKEAELLLKEGYEGMRVRATKIPNNQRERRIAEARLWLTQLYRSTNRPVEADLLESPEKNPAINLK